MLGSAARFAVLNCSSQGSTIKADGQKKYFDDDGQLVAIRA